MGLDSWRGCWIGGMLRGFIGIAGEEGRLLGGEEDAGAVMKGRTIMPVELAGVGGLVGVSGGGLACGEFRVMEITGSGSMDPGFTGPGLSGGMTEDGGGEIEDAEITDTAGPIGGRYGGIIITGGPVVLRATTLVEVEFLL